MNNFIYTNSNLLLNKINDIIFNSIKKKKNNKFNICDK